MAMVRALKTVISQLAGARVQHPSEPAWFHVHSLACLLKLSKVLLKASLSAGGSKRLTSMQATLITPDQLKPKFSARRRAATNVPAGATRNSTHASKFCSSTPNLQVSKQRGDSAATEHQAAAQHGIPAEGHQGASAERARWTASQPLLAGGVYSALDTATNNLASLSKAACVSVNQVCNLKQHFAVHVAWQHFPRDMVSVVRLHQQC